MIETDMREYPLYALPDTPDEYGDDGQPQPAGIVRVSIHLNDRQNTDSVLYAEATYIGLTWRRDITDRHLIQTPQGLKKVLQVLPGRMTRLLLTDWGGGA